MEKELLERGRKALRELNDVVIAMADLGVECVDVSTIDITALEDRAPKKLIAVSFKRQKIDFDETI